MRPVDPGADLSDLIGEGLDSEVGGQTAFIDHADGEYLPATTSGFDSQGCGDRGLSYATFSRHNQELLLHLIRLVVG